jgi:hypothetical protein
MPQIDLPAKPGESIDDGEYFGYSGHKANGPNLSRSANRRAIMPQLGLNAHSPAARTWPFIPRLPASFIFSADHFLPHHIVERQIGNRLLQPFVFLLEVASTVSSRMASGCHTS